MEVAKLGDRNNGVLKKALSGSAEEPEEQEMRG
jgi:hypothetical protein